MKKLNNSNSSSFSNLATQSCLNAHISSAANKLPNISSDQEILKKQNTNAHIEPSRPVPDSQSYNGAYIHASPFSDHFTHTTSNIMNTADSMRHNASAPIDLLSPLGPVNYPSSKATGYLPQSAGRSSQLLDNIHDTSSYNTNDHNTQNRGKPVAENPSTHSSHSNSSLHSSHQQPLLSSNAASSNFLCQTIPDTDSNVSFQSRSSENSSTPQYSHFEQNKPSSTMKNIVSNNFDFDSIYSMNPGMLFMDPTNDLNNHSPTSANLQNQQQGFDSSVVAADTNELISWLFSDALMQSARDPVLSPSWDSPMALQNLLTLPVAASQGEVMALSESKRYKLLQLIPEVCSSLEPSASLSSSSGTNKFEKNIMLESLRRYIACYWLYFHPQYPILHRPTFSPDKCPEGLLWVIIVIGAMYERCDEFSRAVADPLRWVLFGSPDFDPPAKLWVVQALIMLEFYEKIMSNRKLHIRGHIHHGSTLQLIRRGPMLSGSSVFGKGVTATAEAALSSIFGNHQIGEGMEGSASNIMMQACKPDSGFSGNTNNEQESVSYKDPWKRWIQFEETKRAALLAFIMDVNHATMFSHVSLVGVHELRVSLPCREELWESNNPDEVIGQSSNNGKLFSRECNLSSGISFLEALKLTLDRKPVQTEAFGRKVILSGLMSLQYNMQQRDLQTTSIGWSTFKGTWRDVMRSAYMFWRYDYKKKLATEQKDIALKSARSSSGPSNNISTIQGISPLSQMGYSESVRGTNSKSNSGGCHFCQLDQQEAEAAEKAKGSKDGKVIPVSLRNNKAVDILTDIYKYQFDASSSSGPENKMYTCRHGNVFFGKDPNSTSDVADLVANPPKFVLEVQGCADPLLHLAMIDMSIAQYDLQYYCGIISIFNTSVKRADYATAKKRVFDWVRSPQGTESLHFAVHFLKEMYLCGDGHSNVDAEKEIDVCPNSYLGPEKASSDFGSEEKNDCDLTNNKNSYQHCHNFASHSSKRTKLNNDSGHPSPSYPNKSERQTHKVYPNNPYLAIYDPIPHRPYIVFVCAMLVWTYGHVIGGPEDPELWTTPPPLPNFLFHRKEYENNTDSSQGKYYVDEFGNMNGYPIGGYNGSQPVTPAILGHHVFLHMKDLPHKQDGLKYLERLSQETSKAMATRTCVGIRGTGTPNVPLEMEDEELTVSKTDTKSSSTISSVGQTPNNIHSSIATSTSQTNIGSNNEHGLSLNNDSIALPDELSAAGSNNARFYNPRSTTAATEYANKSRHNSDDPQNVDNKKDGNNKSNDHGNTHKFSSSHFPSHTDSSFQINNTAGFLKLVIESLENHRWEMTAEGRRLLTHCLERSMGREEVKCHYFRWEC